MSATYMPDNYIYISHLDEDGHWWRLPCTPETVSDSMSSSFQSTSALGRSAPVFTYSNSGPRTLRVELFFRRDMMDEANITDTSFPVESGEDFVDSLIRALQSISVPKYNLDNKAIEPPLVTLRLGSEIFIKGIVNESIGLEYGLPLITGGRYAQVRLSLTITEVDPYDATTVFTNGSFRGVTALLRGKTGLN